MLLFPWVSSVLFFFKRWFKKLNPDRSFLFYHSDMSLGYWMDKIYIFFYFYLPPYPNTRNDDVSSTGRKGMSSQTKVQNREIALLLLRPFITFGSSWLWFSSIISSVVLHYIMRCCTVFSCIVDFFILWSWNFVVYHLYHLSLILLEQFCHRKKRDRFTTCFD